MIIGRSLTARMAIEPRQYRILRLDLGEGFPRRAAGAFVLVAVCWWLLVAVVLGLGLPSRNTSSLYTLPPVFLTFFGYRTSARQPRRRAYVVWAVRAWYVLAGHRPLIGLGARAPWRGECLSLSDRLAGFSQDLDRFFRRPSEFPQFSRSPKGGVQTGPPISPGRVPVRVYGFDHMQKVR